MTKKQKRFLFASLPVLAVLAFLANADTILGSSAESPAVQAAPPPVEAAAPAPSGPQDSSAPASEARTIPESSLGRAPGATESRRNPFLTVREQQGDESADPQPVLDETPPLQMPGDLWVQIVLVRKDFKVATLGDGRRVHEGDFLLGGKVSSIAKERVVIQFRNGQRWEIPVGPRSPKPKEGSENEAPKSD